MNRIVAPLFELRTYQHSLYFLLQVIIGTVYFTVVVTGLSATLGLALSIFGLPFAAVTGVSTLYLAKQLWNAEGWLLGWYYGEELLRFEPSCGEGLIGWMRETVGDSDSWIALLSGIVRFPLGLFVSTVLVVSQATFLALVASPFYYDRGLVRFGGEAVLTNPVYAAIAAFVGLLGLLLSSHIVRFAGDRMVRALRA